MHAACPRGTAQPSSGQAGCFLCSVNHYGPSTGRTSCLPCSVATGLHQPLVGQTSCVGCGSGSYLSTSGQCQACANGSYQPNEAATFCFTCQPGSYSNASAASCTLCPAGSYSLTAQASACIPCPGTAPALVEILWLIGLFRVLAGSFSAVGGSKCDPCPAAEYQPQPGRPSCLACRTHYSVIASRTRCQGMAS